jgi:hypothetical protein
MRRSNWTPSIVPNGDDQNVYIVIDDFGRLGRAYRETDVERVDLEAVIMDMLEVNFRTRSGSSVSTPPKSGRRTCRPTLPKKYACVAICSCATFHFSFRTLLTATKAGTTTSSFPCRYAWSDQWPIPEPSRHRSASRRRFPVHRARLGVLDRESAIRRSLDPRGKVRRVPGAGSFGQRSGQDIHAARQRLDQPLQENRRRHLAHQRRSRDYRWRSDCPV